jgi:hypothetical protein
MEVEIEYNDKYVTVEVEYTAGIDYGGSDEYGNWEELEEFEITEVSLEGVEVTQFVTPDLMKVIEEQTYMCHNEQR